MGDRVDCTLALVSDATPELLELIAEQAPDDEYEEGKCWSFEGVYKGHMPQPVLEYLRREKIQFTWSYDEGETFSRGIKICDGENEEDWRANHAEILLNLEQAQDPATLARAIAAQALWAKTFP